MAQQVVLGAFWFNPRNLPFKHVTPSKSIVLITEVSSDKPGQVLKSTTSPAHSYFCGILSKQLETDRLNSHKLALRIIVRKESAALDVSSKTIAGNSDSKLVKQLSSSS
ncbi:hypothetical protein Tco_1366358 [Tanacetum coccineum]